ncbi:protein-L-isoaspartate(D-aspartate) O-methyltransferase [Pseudonocardia nigra]|uniref:protein-L-isoaspartate(D-aspartate) O-methyltransferase n=1 Tax=Pseudonocardia nigra TaxID=1921578 RepID=UPI001C5DE1B0|nr:protein-L-isoaspartate(D-aspartate) O-methyltransferase [Pseudonocardia nigra]
MPGAMSAAEERAAMVERLAARGITDERVLAAMAEVPRERFVPADVAADAYADMPLPIGSDQTISAPWIVAFSIEVLGIGLAGTALEIGTGSGYAAAVLSRCCRTVVTVERHPGLAERARVVLAELGRDNVEVRTGDGTAGAPDCAPFDGIVVTAMAEDDVPAALLEQLAPDGTLVCPVGHKGSGSLVRHRAGRREDLLDVAFVPLVTGNPD